MANTPHGSFWQNSKGQPQSQLPLEHRAPGSGISSYRNGRASNTPPHEKYAQTPPTISSSRVRSHTQNSCSPGQMSRQDKVLHNIIGEQNRSRSSSWPNKPLAPQKAVESPSVQRTRSSGSRGRKNTDSPTPRKKRKRLNPQRRSFYKALHNDFPLIAEALREARQGNCVLDSLKSRNIFFTLIEARPPQDPTNLNVRRYNDMVFIWDPSMESWLQVPGNGQETQESVPPLLPPSFSSPQESPQESPRFLPSFQLPTAGGKFTDPAHSNYTYTGPFVSDSSQSEDEDYSHQELSRSLNDFLPMNIINDVL